MAIYVNDYGKVISYKLEQSINSDSSISITESGILIAVNLSLFS